LGKRYLRLDRSITDYARISPSIRREFLTYTLASLPDQTERAKERADAIRHRTQAISRRKRELAVQSMQAVLSDLPCQDAVIQQACFIIAGDVVYDMAHDVPRPESSTGKMVLGSDLDIIVITEDQFPEDFYHQLDDAILQRKHLLLVHPDYREEIDYLIKPMSKVEQQLQFDCFESMVACKIMHEGEFLMGAHGLFDDVKQRLASAGIPDRLTQMEAQAETMRQDAEETLAALTDTPKGSELHHLFYTREESEEIY
jgi:hypothetical protein